MKRRSERGSITLLGIGSGMVVLALIAVGVDATALQLHRTRLWNLADSAALAAADALDHARYFDDGLSGATGGIWLEAGDLRDRAEELLADSEPGSGHDARVVAAHTPDGLTAHVELIERVHLPISGPLFEAWAGGIDVSVTGQARSPRTPSSSGGQGDGD